VCRRGEEADALFLQEHSAQRMDLREDPVPEGLLYARLPRRAWPGSDNIAPEPSSGREPDPCIVRARMLTGMPEPWS
jgi:hypothetical protein